MSMQEAPVLMAEERARYAAHYDDPGYWRGGTENDGYGGSGYADFEINKTRAEYIASLAPLTVLDVGCAYGYLVQRLRALGINARGIDVSSYAIAHADPAVRPYLQQGWAHELPFNDRTIDLLVTFGLLEHLPPELVEPTLREFIRVARRGVISISLSTEPHATLHPENEHPSLHDYRWWRSRIPARFDLWSDATQAWASYFALVHLIIAPGIYPVTQGGRYGGIERLAAYFARGLLGRGRVVKVVAPAGSQLPHGAELLESGPPLLDFNEPTLLPAIVSVKTASMTILDLSHSHPTRHFPYSPALSVIWHDPGIMQPEPPQYNVIALSRWQAQRFRRYQNREARVLDPHMYDADFFTATAAPSEERFLYIGKLHPTKGALEAIRLCKKAGARLDLLGPQTAGDPQDYIQAVLKECDGDQICYFPSVSAASKRELFRRATALIYPVNYPPGQGEAHSHKMAEAIGAGVPCIAYDQGAMSEVIQDGVTGFVVSGPDDMLRAMKDVSRLDRKKVRWEGYKRWSIPSVMSNWMPVLRSVAKGERW